MGKKILVVGSLVYDLIAKTYNVPSEGESKFGNGFSCAPGGKGANQGAAAARLGADVSFIGKTGDDYFAYDLLTSLRESGIDTTQIIREKDEHSGASLITIEEKETGNLNRILVNPGANMKLSLDDVKFLEDTIKEYDSIILQFEIPMEVNEYLADLAHKNGVFVVVNPAPYLPMKPSFLSNIDLLIPNEHEAGNICGRDLDLSNGVDKPLLEKAGKDILGTGVKNVIITLGVNGSVGFTKGEIVYCESIKCKAVDPTAAGDTFLGAFVTAFRSGFSMYESMRIASYASSITVSKMGALPSIPYTREVFELMMKNGDEKIAESLKNNFGFRNLELEDLDIFKKTVVTEVNESLKSLSEKSLLEAMNLILHSEKNGGRVHITGIGKPSHVAEYMASLLSSTGTPTYFLHGTECVHGSAGQLLPGDVVIAISNSGETVELKSTIGAIKNNKCFVIGVSGNENSWLAKNSDVFLKAHVDKEGGPLSKAPRASILSETIVIQALSVMLQSHKAIKEKQYKTWHPGGKLGGTY